MNEQPHQPRNESGKLKPADMSNCGCSSDNRHAAAIAVMKGSDTFSCDSVLKNSPDVLTLLHRHRCDTGKRLAGLMGTIGEIADYEDLRIARKGEIRLNHNSSSPIQFDSGRFGKDLPQE